MLLESGERVDLLEDRHDEAKGHALAPLSLGQGETVLQVFGEGGVERALVLVHHEGFGMDLPACEQWRAVGTAGIGLGAADDHGVQPMAVLEHTPT